MAKIDSYHLNLAGEYRVCSELNKRNIFATITYGQRKGTDVYAIADNNRALRIEVKTSQNGRFVTSITQKKLHQTSDAPDIWVLFDLKPRPNDEYEERFFILSHSEICAAQKARNDAYTKKYKKKHGRSPDLSKGVDNVTIADVEEFENDWGKIIKSLS